ncbi:unnamed protein product [Chironomus riparius]|uniref:Uncharacterized protein n=1 Tax=Chironomus riparius TaxID=315576 RepID=A0A9P0JGN0_9DIPT|nr:unnamed protein product [Chironomus riparius]
MHSSTSTNKDTIFKSPDDGSLINQYEILAQYQKYERDSLPCQQMNNFRQVCDGKLFSDKEREKNNLSRNLRFDQLGRYKIIIFPMTYPFIGFDRGNVNEIYSLIDRAHPPFFELRIQYIKEENEVIKAECLDDYSKRFLTEVVSSWFFRIPQSPHKFPIKIIVQDKMPKFVTFECILDKAINDHAFLSGIIKENNIDTSRCYLDYSGPGSDGYKVIFRADPVCAREIFKKRFILSIRDKSVHFKIVDNPYAKLFRR